MNEYEVYCYGRDNRGPDGDGHTFAVRDTNERARALMTSHRHRCPDCGGELFVYRVGAAA